ncbi:hypothetical protein BDV23DRAFT_172439 [Aspergillus alliaceus]|uniref:NAD(P)-binding protein n=1 Tax=Petromyces alliaceus TaxID=209559 RepID=A0A5N7C800_PETAA|nr:hypothetical protein BDV23DRAFT_172439 [Aspergillus alliaceus]
MTPRSSASVVITGCSSGDISHALAARFYQEGLIIFASSRTISKVEELSTIPYITLVAVAVVEKDIEGRFNYLINSAEAFLYSLLLDIPLNEAKCLFNTNTWGILAYSKYFHLFWGCMNIPWLGIYAEAALNKLGETLRLELPLFHVGVLTVIAGTVNTNIFDNASSVALPAGSVYHPSLDRSVTLWIPANQFVRKVATDVLNGKCGKTWRG